MCVVGCVRLVVGGMVVVAWRCGTSPLCHCGVCSDAVTAVVLLQTLQTKQSVCSDCSLCLGHLSDTAVSFLHFTVHKQHSSAYVFTSIFCVFSVFLREILTFIDRLHPYNL